jgi:transposase
MKIKDHDLRQLNEERLQTLQEKDPAALLQLANRLLDDLKEARERLNQNPSNSSCPSGSQAPWFGVGDEDSPEDDEQEETKDSSDEEPIASDRASSGKEESGNVSSEKEEAHSHEQPKKKAGKGPASKAKNKPGKPPGAQGFGRPKELFINETTHHYPDQCAICGDHLPPESAVAHNAFYTIELILGGPESPGLTLWVTKHIYYTIACACEHENKEMPYRAAPEEGEWKGVELTEWRLAGPGLCAYITWLHFRMRLPIRKIREFLQESFGLSMSDGTLQKCLMETARASDPVFALILAGLLDESLMHADETPHKEAGKPLWLWTFVTVSTVLFVVGRRTKEVWNTIGLLYAGWLMSDGYGVYRDHKKRLRCWAHLIRKAKGLADTFTPWIQGYGIQILEIMDTLIEGVYQAREGPGGSIKAQFQGELDRLKALCEKMARSRHEKASKLGKEFLNDWDAIFRVLDHPELPMTNNAAEQRLRHWVIWRRISQGTRNKKGSRALALIASVIETCRQRKASPLRYLTAVIERRRQGLDVPDLPPIPVEG